MSEAVIVVRLEDGRIAEKCLEEVAQLREQVANISKKYDALNRLYYEILQALSDKKG